MHREIGAFWEVLAQKTIGVLVGAALPRAVGITEVDIQVRGERQALVIGKFLAPIPCEGAAQLPRQVLYLSGKRGHDTGGVLVLDPRDIPTVSGFDDMFANGASIVGLWRLFTDVGGKPGSHMFVGSWASGDFQFVDNPWPPAPDLGQIVSPPQTGSWSLLYILEQQLWADGCNPKRNVGLLSQWGYSDPETNVYEWVGNVSLQANGVLRGREADSMGIGWFYSGLNSEFKNDFSSLLEIRDLTGVEAYYNAGIAPWFHLTADVQVVEPAVRDASSTAFLFGLRAKINL